MENESQNQAAPSTALVPAPASWPGGFGIYKHSKLAVRRNIWTLLLLGIISAIVSGGLQFVFKNRSGDNLISGVVSAWVTGATTFTLLNSVRGKKVEFGEAFSKGLHYFLNMFLLNLLVGIAVVGSLLLFVIPFFFVFPRLELAPYFLIDKNLGPIEAFKASWAATKGHSSKIWGVVGVNILMALLIFTVIGIPFAIYFLIMYSAAYAVLYEWLQKSVPATSPASSAPPTEA